MLPQRGPKPLQPLTAALAFEMLAIPCQSPSLVVFGGYDRVFVALGAPTAFQPEKSRRSGSAEREQEPAVPIAAGEFIHRISRQRTAHLLASLGSESKQKPALAPAQNRSYGIPPRQRDSKRSSRTGPVLGGSRPPSPRRSPSRFRKGLPLGCQLSCT